MSKRKQSKTKQQPMIITVLVIIAAAIYMLIFNPSTKITDGINVSSPDGTLQAHFIDVGQGDSTLMVTPNGEYMLIDAGPNSCESVLKAYLDNLGVTKIKYAVFTHPHEDHIGGADMIINTYEVENIILPDVTHTTATYEKMMKAIDNRGCKIIIANPGDTYSIDTASFKILGPIGTDYESLNDYSVVLRFDFGSESIMFTGDAEALSEKEMLDEFSKSEFKANTLKIGHHCSTTSSTEEFIDAVSPKTAVLFCATGNDYGHPHEEVLNRYLSRGITVHRTDTEGTIVLKFKGDSEAA